MGRGPDWKKSEFEFLVLNSSLSDEQIVKQLPDRSLGAVQAVRGGLHEYHQSGDSSLLSKMMKAHLKSVAGVAICPICGQIL